MPTKFGEWNRGVGVEGDSRVVFDINQIPADIKFDLVIINDVLEHVVDPKKVIKELEKRLNNGAVLLCAFPNKDCLKTKIKVGKWGMVRPWGHLHYFSVQSAVKIFGGNWQKIKQKKVRPGEQNILELIKYFFIAKNYKSFKQLIYLFVNIFLGKDQWRIAARYQNKI